MLLKSGHGGNNEGRGTRSTSGKGSGSTLVPFPGQMHFSLNGVGSQVDTANIEVRVAQRGVPDMSRQRNQEFLRTE